ncbi:MAG: PAS domain S-box protein [Nitrosomonadales bacterium]|nr:PAS domain S-box protein [Nitrosomonadales bacterium]
MKSPFLILFFIALTVFASEAAVMILLHFLPPESWLGEAFSDATLLVIFISPALYFFLFRPLVAHIRERERIEEILRRNEEEQFKIVIHASLDGFLITDVHGHFLEVNDAYCSMLGYSREELLGMDMSGINAEGTPDETARHITRLLISGSDCFETRQRCKDGRILDIEVSANYSKLHGGRIYCFLRDITERKQADRKLMNAKEEAENALQKLEVSTQNLRILTRAIEQSPAVNVITDVNGVIQYVNPKFYELTGYSAAETIGKTPSILNSGVHPKEFYAGLWAAIANGQEWHGEMCNRKKNGELYWEYTHISPVRNEQGEISQFIATKEDITERKRTEEELKLSAQILNSVSDAVFLLDLEGNFIYLNEAAWKSRGYTRDEMMAMNLRELNAPQYSSLTGISMQSLMGNGSGFFESAHLCKDGSVMPVEINARIIESGDKRLLLSVVRDITERKRMEIALQENEEKFRSMSAYTHDAMVMMDDEGNISFWNAAAEKIFGYSTEEVMGKELHSFIAPARYYDAFKKVFGHFRATGEDGMIGNTRELMALRKGGVEFPVELSLAALKLKNKWHGVGLVRDITERKRAEEMLRESEARLKNLFENLRSGVAVYRALPDGRNFIITDFNRAAERIENMRREDVIGKNVTDVFPGIREFGLLEAFRRVWKSGIAEPCPISLYQDGRIVDWRENYVYKLPNGEIVAIYDDVTKEKQAEEQMHYLAHYDALTGLPNRTMFSDRLQLALAAAKRGKTHLALMFIDLDKFKPVNDELGHDVGDLLLKEVAKRMQHCVRESDTVSRIGGDEFTVLLPIIEVEQDAMQVAEKILLAVGQPFELAGHHIHISSSIGVAVYPEHGGEEKLLVKNADTAMYYAKSAGRNNAKLYLPDMVVE